MNKQQVKGLANQATGEIKQQVGKATGDKSLEARGHARELKGKIQEKLGDAQEFLEEGKRASSEPELREDSLKRDR